MSVKIKELLHELEKFASFSYQASWDNSGLICGDGHSELRGVLCSLDVTDAVLDEAERLGCNCIVSHHPIVFKGLKSVQPQGGYDSRLVYNAIRKDIALVAIHTNFDKVLHGVNYALVKKLGLKQEQILVPEQNQLHRLSIMGKSYDIENIKLALFKIGVGKIGDYDSCSFTTSGLGSFRPLENANPSLGSVGILSEEKEQIVDFLVDRKLVNQAISCAKSASSYEELAYFLSPLENAKQDLGYGMVAELPTAMDMQEFLVHAKKKLQLNGIRYTDWDKKVKRVALCGGSGSEFLPYAKRVGADVFITADYKYHQFFDADGDISIVDIGHYESEIHSVELLQEFLSEKFSTFAVRLTGIVTNPVKYF